MEKLDLDFYLQDVLVLAPALLGKRICIPGMPPAYINETEAYRGEEDLACHASKGLTSRTRVMYEEGGILYMYLIYGMHWMMNVVCNVKNNPQAVLIRGINTASGPGRLCRQLKLNGDYNGVSLVNSGKIWLTEGPKPQKILTSPRI